MTDGSASGTSEHKLQSSIFIYNKNNDLKIITILLTFCTVFHFKFLLIEKLILKKKNVILFSVFLLIEGQQTGTFLCFSYIFVYILNIYNLLLKQ